MKIKFVVVNENQLGLIRPDQPTYIHVIASSVLKGADPYNTYYNILGIKNIRKATKKDFVDFHITTDMYEENEQYEFPKS